jgi:hypothetical protein
MWDEFASQLPEIARDINLLEGQMRERQSELDEFARYADVGLPPVLRDGAVPALGVYGFGAWIDDIRGQVVRAAFLHPAASGRSLSLLRSQVGGVLAQSLDFSTAVLAQFAAVPFTPPEPLGGPIESGASISVDGARGTLGAATRCPEEGDSGFTTAGHVASRVGSSVYAEDGEVLGTVERSSPQPTQRSGPDPVADVAFIRSGHAGNLFPLAVRSPRLGDRVVVQANDGYRSTFVRGVSPAILIRPDVAPWGEVAITAEAVSRHGDSGAPAFTDWGGGLLIGHVVGGAPNDYSLIQDISYQYAALGLE